jgi:hypothetical protein
MLEADFESGELNEGKLIICLKRHGQSVFAWVVRGTERPIKRMLEIDFESGQLNEGKLIICLDMYG